LSKITYPAGEVVTYSYNLLNQLTKVTDYKGREILYTYDENGRLLTTKTPDGTVEICTYNVAGQLIQKKIAYKDNVVTHKYSYDETYKTISESAEIQNESIFPELNGIGNFNDAVMSYGNGNRLETYNGKTLTYDNDGNMTKAPLDGTMTEYVYDKYNNLISVGTTQYSYDAEGTRISQSDNGKTTTYITNKNVSLSQLLVKQNSDGTETIYVYGLGLISQETKTGATYSNYRAYQFDNRGSALTLTNQSGEITDRFFFDPYGELIGRHGNTDTIFMYVGKYGVQTDNNGLLYMRARYYKTDIKRFVNVDPIRDGLNWYGYVEGNPIDFIDPTGLWLETGLDIVMAAFSTNEFLENPSLETFGYAALDVVFLFVPVIPGGAGAILGKASKIDNIPISIIDDIPISVIDDIPACSIAYVDEVANGLVDAISTKTFKSWDELKSEHYRTVTNYVKNHKPKGSPDIKKWFESGGTIKIETFDNGIETWTYIKAGKEVPYVPQVIDGKIFNVVKFPNEFKHPDSRLAQFQLEDFTGNRYRDKKNALDYIEGLGFEREIPDGYILHHDVENGVFQLIEKDAHNTYRHYGGHFYNK